MNHWRILLSASALCGWTVGAAAPDGGLAGVTFTSCDASACGEAFLRERGIEEVSPNLGMKPSAPAPQGAAPVKVSPEQAIHVAVGQTRFIRLPCKVSRFGMGNTPWDITSTGSRTDFLLRGLFEGRSALRAWCDDQSLRVFDVFVEPR